jgi:hypothetical protein
MATGFITDADATKIAKRLFSEEAFADFERRRDLTRHFEDCLENNTPSPHCTYTDLAENLRWCRIGLRIEGAAFEDYLQQIIAS